MDIERRLRIEHECQKLITQLVHHYDHGRAEQAAALFVPDGLWVKTGIPYRGRSEIIASFAAQPKTLLLRHFTSNVLITVHDEQNASAVTYYLAFVTNRDQADLDAEMPIELPKSLGEWSDTFVLTHEGWRFTRREGRRVFGARATKR